MLPSSVNFLHSTVGVLLNVSMNKPVFTSEEEVMFYDTDIGGVVHNLAYLRMIESNRTKLARAMGMDLLKMAEENVYPVLLRTEADYKKPGTLSDILRIDGRLETVEKVRFWFSFDVYRESDNALLVSCRQSLAIVKMPEGRPQRLPKEWIEQWGGE